MGSAPIWAVGTQFHENCDSTVKSDWDLGPNFMKIAIRP